jgi:hypothetical protein
MFHKKKLLEKRKREEQEQVTIPIDIKNEHPTTKKIKSESVPSSPITPLTPRQVYRQQSDGNVCMIFILFLQSNANSFPIFSLLRERNWSRERI